MWDSLPMLAFMLLSGAAVGWLMRTAWDYRTERERNQLKMANSLELLTQKLGNAVTIYSPEEVPYHGGRALQYEIDCVGEWTAKEGKRTFYGFTLTSVVNKALDAYNGREVISVDHSDSRLRTLSSVDRALEKLKPTSTLEELRKRLEMTDPMSASIMSKLMAKAKPAPARVLLNDHDMQHLFGGGIISTSVGKIAMRDIGYSRLGALIESCIRRRSSLVGRQKNLGDLVPPDNPPEKPDAEEGKKPGPGFERFHPSHEPPAADPYYNSSDSPYRPFT